MNTGKLRHRVSVQLNTPTPSTRGDKGVDHWSEIAAPMAAVERLSGREFYGEQQINAEATTKISMHYVRGLEPLTRNPKVYRIVWDDHTFDILSADNVEFQNRDLILMCKEVLG